MKIFQAILLIVGLCVFFDSSARAGITLSFSTMEDGDRVEISYSSKGCFHDYTRYYEVCRREGVSVFTQYEITWQKGLLPKIMEKRVIGELKLSKSEVVGLDGLLRYYRGYKEASSTTLDAIRVEYYKGSKLFGIETLRDDSGGYELDSRKDVVQFYQLANRFKK